MLLDPTGEAIAVWEDEAFDLLSRRDYSAEADKLQVVAVDGRQANSVLITGPGRRLQPLSWSAGGQSLFMMSGESLVVELSRETREVTKVAELGPQWRHAHFTTAAHGDAGALLQAANGKARALVETESDSAILATITATEVNLARLPSSPVGAVEIEDGTRLVPLDIPPFFLHQPLVLRDGETRKAFGLGHHGDHADVDVGYRRPLVDLGSGRLAGSFGLQTLQARSVAPASVKLLLDSLPQPYFLRDASLSGADLAVLFSDLNGEVGVAFLSNEQVKMVPICDFQMREAARKLGGPIRKLEAVPDTVSQHPEAGGPSDDPANRVVREIDFAQERPGTTNSVGVLVSGGAGPAEDLVVYFHGGPAGSGMDSDEIGGTVRRLALPKSDVLLFEYSGSAARSPKLFSALREEGPAAIEDDVAALATWLERQPYRRVHLIGVSFGSVPALAALAESRLEPCSVSLVVPLLKWVDASEAVGGRGEDRARQVQARTAFEEAVFGRGGVERLQNWLDRKLSLAGDPRVHFYFASRDPRSRAEHLPEGAASSDRIHVLDGTHGSVPASRELWSAVRDEVVNCGAGGRPAAGASYFSVMMLFEGATGSMKFS